MTRQVLVVGVPWSIGELAVAAADAASLDAYLTVVDTQQALRGVGVDVPCGRRAVAELRPPDILGALDDVRFDAVVSITELTMELAAQVRERLGLPGTPAVVERAVTDKWLTRDTLVRAGLAQPRYWDVCLDDLPDFIQRANLPVIVKPRAFTGSTGVSLITEPSQVGAALRPYDRHILDQLGRDTVLVEEYIPGPEVSAEGLVVDGSLTLLGLTDKINTGEPVFYEIGHVMPSRHSGAWHSRVQRYLQQVVTALGIVTSPVHAELKLVGDRVELVELHSRFGGGNIVELLKQAYGINAYQAYLAAVLDGESARRGTAEQVWGVGFFVGRIGHPMRWSSFGFPFPHAVTAMDYDARRRPKVLSYEGLRIQYWRAGHVLFASPRHTEVFDNIDFIRATVANTTRLPHEVGQDAARPHRDVRGYLDTARVPQPLARPDHI
jgi:hypothetical protein